jgi:sortase A
MSDKYQLDDLTVDELEQLLYRKKRAQRLVRLRRLKGEGRLVEVNGVPPPIELEGMAVDRSLGDSLEGDEKPEPADDADDLEERHSILSRIKWRWVANRFLLLIEVGAVVGLVVVALLVWTTARELNQEIAVVQQTQSESLALPTAAPTPVIGVAILPSGHKPPVEGRPPEPGEAGEIPAHLLPIIDAYVPPPIPTPGPEQARRIQIPAIDVDKPIVQGDDWEQLKKGVGQNIGSSLPGQPGNVVLSAHNDIYGEIFRDLDKLKPGDEIIISTERQSYTYVVNDIDVVEPTEVSVMSNTEHASTTLISCYPYLVNNKRIVVFADLATVGLLSADSS